MFEEVSELPQEVTPTKEKLSYQPKISVVIPVLNRKDEVEKVLGSLEKQDYQGELEIIVADAGSTDGTKEIAQSRGANVVEVLHGSGIGATRKAGCDSVTGEIIVNTDSDCELPEGYLSTVASVFSDPEVIASYGPVEYTYSGKPPDNILERLVQMKMELNVQRKHRRGQPMLAGPNFVILKSVYDALGGFDPRTERIEEPVLYIPLREMPGKIVFEREQKVSTELPWQEKGKPSLRKLRAYKAKNQRWVSTAKQVIEERRENLSETKAKVSRIVEERKERLEQVAKE